MNQVRSQIKSQVGGNNIPKTTQWPVGYQMKTIQETVKTQGETNPKKKHAERQSRTTWKIKNTFKQTHRHSLTHKQVNQEADSKHAKEQVNSFLKVVPDWLFDLVRRCLRTFVCFLKWFRDTLWTCFSRGSWLRLTLLSTGSLPKSFFLLVLVVKVIFIKGVPDSLLTLFFGLGSWISCFVWTWFLTSSWLGLVCLTTSHWLLLLLLLFLPVASSVSSSTAFDLICERF